MQPKLKSLKETLAEMNAPRPHQDFPKWKYKKHHIKPFVAKLVHTEGQEQSLGPDWHDSPAEWHETCPSEKPFSTDEDGFEFQSPDEPVKRGRGRPPKVQVDE